MARAGDRASDGAAWDLAFGASGLDRAGALRRDGAAMAALGARPGAALILLRDGQPLVEGPADAPRLVRLPAREARAGPGAEAPIFLGLEEGDGVWAAALPPGEPSAYGPGAEDPWAPDRGTGRRWADLRAVMSRLAPRDGELAATARAVGGWHATHRFCARCGAPTVVAMAGWQRDCPACGTHHFPRTDPVAIMLVTRGNSVLLGRSPGWPPAMFSLLAGFVEPGETVEAAVRRETWEEAGVRVGRVGYLASQPWPFPSSLMLGCWGEALDEGLTVDPEELEAALWVPRERLARIFAGRDDAVRTPRAGAIAGVLLRSWLADRLDRFDGWTGPATGPAAKRP